MGEHTHFLDLTNFLDMTVAEPIPGIIAQPIPSSLQPLEAHGGQDETHRKEIPFKRSNPRANRSLERKCDRFVDRRIAAVRL